MTSLATFDDQTNAFAEWLSEIRRENPNIELLAKQLEGFSDTEFRAWLEDGLSRIVLRGEGPLGAFRPGQLIVGALSRRSWREELLAAVALLPEPNRNGAVRGFTAAFTGIAPDEQANDVSLNEGKNYESLVLELLKIVREMRRPLCNIEATPLDALRHLLTVQYPRSEAVFYECLITWRAFVHQVRLNDASAWRETFENHQAFRDDCSPFLAFGFAACDPTNAVFYMFQWPPIARYRRSLANGGSQVANERFRLRDLNVLSLKFLCRMDGRDETISVIAQHISRFDSTIRLTMPTVFDGLPMDTIFTASSHAKKSGLTLAALEARRNIQLDRLPLTLDDASLWREWEHA